MQMKLRFTLALTLAATSAIALAQEPAKSAEDTKPVTRLELNAKLDSDYSDLDADKDGKVTPAEINSRLVKSAEAQIEKIKKERDEAFAKLDSDGNGAISRAEFDARVKLPTAKAPDAQPFMDQFDANKDGAITKDEFRAPTLANFDKLDRNKDGTVSVAEIKAGPPVKKPPVKQTPPIGR
jgi:hypothetical protein